ncbi:YggS family pyridoxal phosphate-dependent enzyme [Lapillicoccus jejuensis]|uniref:Pyridoxal phosphate homeostasis protein n=1 Tax=Lapillicoccus jejuensis TaxID=402171 RepID=A0A542E6Q9_9MICO|nr:YggS family pyridoxal phosphate-dependent enzyme [Lapillicoccus jejuensis]TQJ11022.1 hypothetical protein FB458_4171 [Lapillicoccus jejuensis]
MSGDDPRRVELAERLAAVEQRVARACEDAGRDRSQVTLVVVTKFFPAADVRLLAGLGVRDVGESRVQEALAKAQEDALAPWPAPAGERLTTHFIGQVQTNKAAAVVGWADLIHSVDRPKLVRALDRAAQAAGTVQGVLLQVDLEDGADAGRGGVRPADLPALAELTAGSEGLDLAGLMAVAPRGADPDAAFARLAELAAEVRASYPGAVVVSAGMSGDLEDAVRHGATHLRVGSAILGARPGVR